MSLPFSLVSSCVDQVAEGPPPKWRFRIEARWEDPVRRMQVRELKFCRVRFTRPSVNKTGGYGEALGKL